MAKLHKISTPTHFTRRRVEIESDEKNAVVQSTVNKVKQDKSNPKQMLI